MSQVTSEAVERVFRAESGAILATLLRVLKDFDLAEEVLQDSLVAAMETWPRGGIPDNPGAWLTTTARNRAIDRRRKNQNTVRVMPLLVPEEEIAEAPCGEDAVNTAWSTDFGDDRLRLIFTCCHPSLNRDAQIALTLKTLGGLQTEEIARAFLLTPASLAQRLVRAKRKIREAGIPYRIPEADELGERLPPVLHVLYLIFNEGYVGTTSADLLREDLCQEAIRLTRVLHALMPGEAELRGLLALLLFQNARRLARTSESGDPILLEDQDRSRWNRAEIEEAKQLLQGLDSRAGPYTVQAAIAGCHSTARSAKDTDWAQILKLYDALWKLHPTDVVALNRTVALAQVHGWERALKETDALETRLRHYLYFHSTRADFLRRLGRTGEARRAYETALGLTKNESELRFLRSRLEECE